MNEGEGVGGSKMQFSSIVAYSQIVPFKYNQTSSFLYICIPYFNNKYAILCCNPFWCTLSFIFRLFGHCLAMPPSVSFTRDRDIAFHVAIQ